MVIEPQGSLLTLTMYKKIISSVTQIFSKWENGLLAKGDSRRAILKIPEKY